MSLRIMQLLVESIYLYIMEYLFLLAYPDENLLEWIMLGGKYVKNKSLQNISTFNIIHKFSHYIIFN